jgi:CheY-like chemotaxis protein
MSRILVIDDSPLQRTYARLVLEDAGYEVLEASGGEEGLQQIRSRSPDCVLLDLFMPDISGLDVLRRFQLEGHMMPVIVVTAEDHNGGRTACVAAGAAAVIDKPSNPAQLLHAVSSALSRGPGGHS